MPHDIRKIEASEFNDWRVMVRLAFNEHVHPDDIERLRTQRAELDRLYAAFDGRKIVGTGGIDSYTVTLPGGTKTPAAGIAYIGTAPDHRRQGIQRQMMSAVENDARERDESVALLWASQSGLYTRYGYGMATVQDSWRIATDHSAFVRHIRHHEDVTVRLVDADEAMKLLPRIYDRARETQPGFVDISDNRWKYILFDAERVRGGASGFFFLVAERHGNPEGYAVYRIRRTGDFDLGSLHVWGQAAATPEADTAIWRFIFDMDLVDTVTAVHRPVDAPTWWQLVDPRRLQRSREDGMWCKLLDPVPALGGRRYAVEDSLVVETWDGDSTTTYEIEGSREGAKCQVSHKTPDLSMKLADLSSAFLGESHFFGMVAAGRVEERTTGAARRADLMFGWNPRPWSPYFF